MSICKQIFKNYEKMYIFGEWFSSIVLYIQSAVDEQRRIIGCHCLFFILLYIKHKNIGAKDKMQITITVIFRFIAL